ncbi:MAG: TetR/AcrR family transcriptional regulator [Bacteroidaceae bacterium]|nr:TetR/AcrR family transcriptional regulator [Bacteroidaceae bacterium]
MTVVNTRVKFVDVARRLFAKNGLENTTMNDIAQASGKGRRTLYTYFKNKEEIYWAVIEGELERINEKMSEVARQQMEPEDKLVEVIYTHLNMIKEAVQRNGNLRAEFFRNIIMVEKVRKNFDRSERCLFASILSEGVQQGRFDIDSIPLSSDILHYCIKGLEIPYIYGRLAEGMPHGMRRGIVQKLIHKAFGRQDKHLSQYL